MIPVVDRERPVSTVWNRWNSNGFQHAIDGWSQDSRKGGGSGAGLNDESSRNCVESRKSVELNAIPCGFRAESHGTGGYGSSPSACGSDHGPMPHPKADIGAERKWEPSSYFMKAPVNPLPRIDSRSTAGLGFGERLDGWGSDGPACGCDAGDERGQGGHGEYGAVHRPFEG